MKKEGNDLTHMGFEAKRAWESAKADLEKVKKNGGKGDSLEDLQEKLKDAQERMARIKEKRAAARGGPAAVKVMKAASESKDDDEEVPAKKRTSKPMKAMRSAMK